MRRVTPGEVQKLADLFLHGKLLSPIHLTVAPIAFSVSTVDEHGWEPNWQMNARRMEAAGGTDSVLFDGRSGWLNLMVGPWSDQPDNEQVVLSSGLKELDERFGQINLNLSLTDGRALYLVKSVSKEAGPGAIARLYGNARGAEKAQERASRRRRLVAALGNETILFDDDEWLVVAVLPLRIPKSRYDALFTESLVQILRYAAQVERLRRGDEGDWDLVEDGERLEPGFGRRPSAAERKLIELEAMAVVRAHLEKEGYQVTDVASRESYDLEVRRGKEVRYIEVKGTTSRPWAVELTGPEHRVASRQGDRYSMYVVVFEALQHLDRYELVAVGNPVTSPGYEVAPVRYRVREQ